MKKYDEIIAKNSMDPEEVKRIINGWRIREKVLMEERSSEIENGLRHETESMKKDKMILGET